MLRGMEHILLSDCNWTRTQNHLVRKHIQTQNIFYIQNILRTYFIFHKKQAKTKKER